MLFALNELGDLGLKEALEITAYFIFIQNKCGRVLS